MNDEVTQVNVGQTKLIFGKHALKEICSELRKLGVKKPLIVTDRQLRQIGMPDALLSLLEEGKFPYAVYDGIKTDPSGSEVDRGVVFLKGNSCDGVIGIGGGSVMDSAKCITAMATNGGVLMDQNLPLLPFYLFYFFQGCG